MLTVADFASVSNPDSNGYFLFDNAGPNAETLYWDANGGSGADAVPIAVVTGVTQLVTSDFHLI